MATKRVIANLDIAGTIKVDQVGNASVDTDKFLVKDADGVIKYRTGAQILSDISAAPAAAGVPTGGTTGQILAKIDGTNYNTQWIDNYTEDVRQSVKAGEAINKGQAVYISGAYGTNPIVSKASNNTEAASSKTLGLLAQTLATNGKGFVITEGKLSGLDTSAAQIADPVWLGTNGNLLFGVANKPVAPANLVYLGVVTRVNQNNGEIFVHVVNGFELDELHDVLIQSVANKDILYRDTSTNLWKNASIATILGYTPADAARTLTVNGTAYDLTANRSWTVGDVRTDSSYANPSWITSLGWNKITSTPTTLGGYGITDAVISGRTLTINGTAYDLSADRSWNVGTITALTGEVTASGTGSVAATLSNSAVINKVLTGLNLTGGGTISAADSILQAFGKVQNQISALVGGVTYQGVWNATTNTPSISSSVGSKGQYYVVSVAGSTSIDGISDWRVGDWIIYNGSTWDKVDNTDAVSSVNGYTGAVSLTTSDIVEGTRLYYTDARARLALSAGAGINYNSSTGVISSTITQYTDTNARAALSFAAGSGAYNSSTGVITIPTNNNQLINGAGYITSSALSGYVPYTGATSNVNLGNNTLSVGFINILGGSAGAAGYLGFKQSLSTITAGAGYTSITAEDKSYLVWHFDQNGGTNYKWVRFNISGVTNNTLRTYNLPNADGTIALTGDIPTNNNQLTNGAGYITSSALSGYVQGSGTTNYVAKFTGSGTTIGNSIIYDNGTNVGIGTNNPLYTLDVNGTFETSFTDTALTNGNSGSRIYATFTPSTNTSNRNLYNINQIGAFNFTSGALLGSEAFNVTSHFSQVTIWGNNGTRSTQPIRSFLTGLTGFGGQGAMNIADFRFLDIKSPDAAGVAGHTVSTIYGLKIAALKGTSNFSITNGWGVYQEGSQDNNYFAGTVLINNTADNGSGAKLQVSGGGYFNGNLTTNGFSYISPASGNAIQQITRTSTANGAGLALYTNSTHNWLLGTAWGETSSNFILYNAATGTQSFKVDYSTNAATFSSSVTAGGNVLVPAGSGLAWSGDASRIMTPEDNVSGALIQTPGIIRFRTGGNEAMRINASGNVGIGVTPSAWGGGATGLQVQYATVEGRSSVPSFAEYAANSYTVSGVRYYIASDFASRYTQFQGQHIWLTAPSGTAGNAITFTQAMTLDASGNLKVGVNGGTNYISIAGDASANGAFLYADPSQFILSVVPANPMIFRTSNTERMRITSGGKVVIGLSTTTYGTLLGVETSISASPVAHFKNSRNTSGDSAFYIELGVNARNTSSYYLQCFDSGQDQLYIYGNGNVVNRNNSYGALSDISLKENIIDASPKLADILKVKVRNYNLIGDTNKQIGVIAQELEDIFPSMVEIDGKSGMKQVKYSVFVPMLIKAIQEQQQEINNLKSRL